MPIISFDDMKEKKSQVMNILLDIAENIDESNKLGLSINGKPLLDLKNKLDDDNFKVLVIGEFKHGKSTFINSLLGEKILPAYSRPCTAVINEVKYGGNKKATLFFKNPLPDQMSEDIHPEILKHINKYKDTGNIPPFEIDVNQLKDYVTIPDPTKDQADSIRELPYSKVVLEYPIELCRNGIEVIDSPGLNENQARTKVTEEYLGQADAIVFVFKCPGIASQNEMDYIEDQIRIRGYKDIFMICNGFDQVDDDEDEKEKFVNDGYKKLSEYTDLGKKGIFFLSAKIALKAKIDGNENNYKTSGLLGFEKSLSEYLRNKRGQAKLINIINPCIDYLDTINNKYISNYLNSLENNINDLNLRIKNATPKLEIAEQKKDLVVKKINFEVSNLKNDFSNSICNQYKKIIEKIPKFVDEMDIDNKMSSNPFKQEKQKEALEKEVIEKLQKFVEKEMNEWIKDELTNTINSFMESLKNEIGEDLNLFYSYIDDYRYEVSGVQKPEDIAAWERVTAGIIGTIVGGPAYGALGVGLGIGEIVKRSAILLSAAFAIGLLFPVGEVVLALGVIGSGIYQMITGGKALTEKYKEQLKKTFIEKIEEDKLKSSKEFAEKISKDIASKLAVIEEVMDNEIKAEKSKVEALLKDKADSEEARNQKKNKLKQIIKNIENDQNELIVLKQKVI